MPCAMRHMPARQHNMNMYQLPVNDYYTGYGRGIDIDHCAAHVHTLLVCGNERTVKFYGTNIGTNIVPAELA